MRPLLTIVTCVFVGLSASSAACARRTEPIGLTYPHAGFGRVGCFAGPGFGYRDSTVVRSVDSAATRGPWLVLDSISLTEWKRAYAPQRPERPELLIWTLVFRVDSLEGTRVVASRLIDLWGEWRRVMLDSVVLDNRGASFAPTDRRFVISSTDIRGKATMHHDVSLVMPSGDVVPIISTWQPHGLRIPCARVPLVDRGDTRSFVRVDRSTVLAALRRLAATDDSTRANAYHAMLGFDVAQPWSSGEATAALLRDHSRDRKRIATALIALLERENVVANEIPEFHSGTTPYAIYHERLTMSVALLYDPSAMPALLGAMNVSNAAASGMAALGARAIPGLVRTTQTSSRYLARWGAVAALTQMMKRTREFTLTRENLESIRVAAISALGDPHKFVREAAMRALDSFDDAETRRAIERLAQSDPDSDVRAIAEAWLKRHRSRDAR